MLVALSEHGRIASGSFMGGESAWRWTRAAGFSTVEHYSGINGMNSWGQPIAGQASDVDSGALSGIAVTGLSSSTGTWQYSTDNGSTWADVGTVNATSSLLLYTGDLFPLWKGNFLVGALKYMHVQRLVMKDGMVAEHEVLGAEDIGERVRDVKQGPDGAVYLVTDDGGRILREAADRYEKLYVEA